MNWAKTHSFSRSSGVSLGVPRVLTSRWKVETAVLIWKMPEATACVVSCLPLIRFCLDDNGRPASRSWKLMIAPSLYLSLLLTLTFSRKIFLRKGLGKQKEQARRLFSWTVRGKKKRKLRTGRELRECDREKKKIGFLKERRKKKNYFLIRKYI